MASSSDASSFGRVLRRPSMTGGECSDELLWLFEVEEDVVRGLGKSLRSEMEG